MLLSGSRMGSVDSGFEESTTTDDEARRRFIT
jgi:hypothetical protein